MEAKQLCFSYNNTSNFFDDVSIKLHKGKITTILGPNGSGKSTLLNLFVNQFAPNAGDVLLAGQSIYHLKQKEIAKKVAVVHQHNTAPNDLTVQRLVEFGRVPHYTFWNTHSQDDDDIVDWAIKATNIEHLKHKSLAELSGGERQRTWIAMSLAQKTNILFLDEPTTYLDIAYQMEILQLIKTLNRDHGITVVMVLHDINQAIQYSDNFLILKNGKIMYDGKAEDALTKQLLQKVYGINAVIKWCPENGCKHVIPIQSI